MAALKLFADNGQLDSPIGRLHPGAARNAIQVAGQLMRILEDELGPVEEQEVDDKLTLALLSGFPDRLCKRRKAGQPRGVMVGGRGVKLDRMSGVQDAELFLAINVDGRGSEATVRLATAVEQAFLPGNLLTEDTHRFYNPTTTAVVTRHRVCWSDLVLGETPMPTPVDQDTARMLAPEVTKSWHKILPAKDKELQAWLHRIAWLGHENCPSLNCPRCLEMACRARSNRIW